MPDIVRQDDTIAAIATPFGTGGIGIVRASGPMTIPLFKSVFRPARPVRTIRSHHLYYGWVVDPGDNNLVDEVLAVVMMAPHSYTTEDVLEIQCHSGPAVVRRILEILLEDGARLAEPGEFTKRAFLGGRIDLAQAEAVLDLTLAPASTAGRLAVNQLQGHFSQRLGEIRATLLEALAAIEVAIDYPEEDLEILQETQLSELLSRRVIDPLQSLADAFTRGSIYKTEQEVLIVGIPNVGKSSLLNAIVCEDRAIVTSIPGTTRDTIEATAELGGIAVRLVDTAGIRPDPDPIERLGMRKIREKLDTARLILWMLDVTRPLTADDMEVGRNLIPLAGKDRVVLVFNKIDLDQAWKNAADDLFNEIVQAFPSLESAVRAAVSASRGDGLDSLAAKITGRLLDDDTGEPLSVVPNLRQKEVLQKAIVSTDRACAALSAGMPPDLVAIDLRDALNVLGEITGHNITDEILDHIFSNFCLGK